MIEAASRQQRVFVIRLAERFSVAASLVRASGRWLEIPAGKHRLRRTCFGRHVRSWRGYKIMRSKSRRLYPVCAKRKSSRSSHHATRTHLVSHLISPARAVAEDGNLWLKLLDLDDWNDPPQRV
jgi:hypothetical protein